MNTQLLDDASISLVDMKMVEEIAHRIRLSFPSFGGGVVDANNPFSQALANEPAQFSGGVAIREVVMFVLGAAMQKVTEHPTAKPDAVAQVQQQPIAKEAAKAGRPSRINGYKQKLEELAAEGASMSKMARETGLDPRTVKRYLKKLGLRMKKRQRRAILPPTDDALKPLWPALEKLGDVIEALRNTRAA